jgi:hypothetical protein
MDCLPSKCGKRSSFIEYSTDNNPAHGRNLTLLRYPQCTRLVQVGLPNRLRGEMWETLSGSIYLRFANPGFYDRLLAENKGRTTTSTEDIEKDLHRSLPEYAGYQSEDGISALRRVLQAYSFKNPELGYCQVCCLTCSMLFRSELMSLFQAMNILAAAVLMYELLQNSNVLLTLFVAICQRSKRSGSWKSSATAFCLDTTGSLHQISP